MDQAPKPLDPSRIIGMASAFYESCVLFAASDAGIFETLSKIRHASATELAKQLRLDERATRLLCDGCVALGLLHKEESQYRLTPESAAFLVPGSAGDLSQAIRYNRDVYSAWGRLGEFLHSGQPVERPSLHLGEDEARTRTFVTAMHHRAMAIGRGVIPQLDFQTAKRILDVGGGSGAYSILAVKAYPHLRSTVLDLPPIVALAKEWIASERLEDRIDTLPGDYHSTPFPPENDAILFFGMLHQESPEAIRDLFRRAYHALVPGGKVIVMDLMTDRTHTSPRFSALFAINMALTTSCGWVFSDEELRGWLTEAGFGAIEIRPLPPPMPHWLAIARRS